MPGTNPAAPPGINSAHRSIKHFRRGWRVCLQKHFKIILPGLEWELTRWREVPPFPQSHQKGAEWRADDVGCWPGWNEHFTFGFATTLFTALHGEPSLRPSRPFPTHPADVDS